MKDRGNVQSQRSIGSVGIIVTADPIIIMPYSELTKKILKKDIRWCRNMGLYNTYRDPWPVLITKNIPHFDSIAYNKFPKHNFVYDKLWVAQTQNIQCVRVL